MPLTSYDGTLSLPQNSRKVWRNSDVKNAARGRWTPGCIMPNHELNEVVRRLCQLFQADYDRVVALIFNVEAHYDYTDALVEQVALAVLHAANRGVVIFEHLKSMGFLKSLEELQEIFPRITPQMALRLTWDRFQPGSLPARDFDRVFDLLYQLGIPRRFCAECARVIAPAVKPRGKRHNPSAGACLDRIVQALFQRDITSRKMSIGETVERLASFDISRSRVYALRRIRFSANSIPDTRENRFLIQRVTRKLRLPAEPFYAAILAPRREEA